MNLTSRFKLLVLFIIACTPLKNSLISELNTSSPVPMIIVPEFGFVNEAEGLVFNGLEVKGNDDEDDLKWF